jgi:CRP-like cAMP-binding protein
MFQNHSVPLSCDRDRVLFYQGESPAGLYILSKGSATLSWSGPDRQFDITLQTTLPSLIGLPSLMQGDPHSFTLIAHSGAKLSFVTLYNFALMVEFDQFLALRSLQALKDETRAARRASFDQFNGEAMIVA